MCGIVGIINYQNKKVNQNDIKKMLKTIKHRGPDGEGVYINGNIGLGHVLLKIQDITEKSKQPYRFENLVITYNGEIYNFKELRKELEKFGYAFDTNGDTEVLIKLIHKDGIDLALQKIEGCFAFALYDMIEQITYIVRDRFGIKPLHYYIDNEQIIFSSEIKAILSNENIKHIINYDTLLLSLNCRLWMDQHKTLFKDIYMLHPGTYLKIANGKYEFIKYYTPTFSDEYKDKDKLIRDFKDEFENSVKKKLISKVPVAAFLSGGLDSSIVCKILNDNMNENLNTYTIHYDFDNDLDLNHAKILAENEGFHNHNVLIKEEMYNLENIDKVTYAVEEVLIDKVYIPMYFNYNAAKKDGYTVVISGQGSDEVWLGYIKTWKIFTYLDQFVDNKYLINEYYKKNMIFKGKIKKSLDEKIDKILNNYLEDYLNIKNKDKLNAYGDLSLKTILHDLLMQEDKIAMANSIESRVPFVDNHRIVELAYKASSKLKTFDGREKYIVRMYSKNKIDNRIVDREKYPFPEPPKIYNEIITKLCIKHWESIKNSKIISNLIKTEYLNDIDNFSKIEQWWLLNYWRFEEVFNMEVDYE